VYLIKITKIKDPFERWSLLSNFDSQKECLIVPDIKTKLSVEQYLLHHNHYLENDPVLRIYEFYESLFYNMQLQWNLVSDHFVGQFFLDFVSSYSDSKLNHLKDSKKLLSYLNQFLPILFYPKHSELLEEWFSAKSKDSFVSWKKWYYLCKKFFQEMQLKKTIHHSGLKYFLMSELPDVPDLPFLKNSIKVDLGLYIDKIDMDILKELGSKTDVMFLVPDLELKEFYGNSIDVYKEFLSDIPDSCVKKATSNQITSPLFFKHKNITQLEEIKKVTAQIRHWLHQGIKASDIVVLAPDIEAYWLALKIHLDQDNIQVQKASTTSVFHFTYIKYWLASLKLHIGFGDFFTLEEYVFYNNPKESFSHFYAKYSHMFDGKSDLPILYKKGKTRNPNQKIKGAEFIAWAISFLPKDQHHLLDVVLQSFQSVLLESELRWIAWIKILESELFTKTIPLVEESTQAVSCLSLNAINSIRGKYIFILGLDEDSLQITSSGSLSQKDRDRLLLDLGFVLSDLHPRTKEYSLLWFLQSSQLKEVFLSFASTDFIGTELAPSLFYILSDHLFKIEANPDVEGAFWDTKRQQKSLDAILSQHSKDVVCGIKQYYKRQDKPIPYYHKENMTLAGNKLQLFDACPFKYAAKYLFYVDDLSALEYEMSPLDVGLVVHKLFFVLLKEKSLDINQKKIKEIIDQFKPDEKNLLGMKQWQVNQKYLIHLSMEFLQKEREKRQDLPHILPIELEKEFTAYWNKSKSTLDHTGDYLFKGRIDRIDYNRETESYLVIDYKPSADSVTHITSWLNKNAKALQMPIYAQAIERGLVEDVARFRVSGTLYYTYKDFKIKGYIEKESDSLYSDLKNSRIQFEREVLKSAFKKANYQIQTSIKLMEEGRFFPKPKDKANCKECSWRKWCRARHLN